ncbi:MAG TPA: ATP-binding protein [Flavisolibacter sp.]|nr:ATP-binding protein [Flavisolibacter sp.]
MSNSLYPDNRATSFLSGGGDMGERMRALDWSETPLGAIETWPQSLRSALSICLNSNFPIAIYWGPQLTLLYNDAWSPIPGNKHPWSLGRPAREVFPEIWQAIEPQFQKAFSGIPGGSKDALLPMERHGYVEECYFDFTFTPIYGEQGKVEGVFNAVIETTDTILNERQLQTIQELSNLEVISRSVDEILVSAAQALEKNNKDFPFGIIYKTVDEGRGAQPFSFFGVGKEQRVFPVRIDLVNPDDDTGNFFKAFTTQKIVVSENNNRRINLPTGGWDKEATHFVHIPIVTQHHPWPLAVISAALNPFRRFDDSYRQFAQLIADQITTEINNVLVYEEEKRKAEALAEIDRAKTTFFTNISHEFRTPLTLMLGSLEELLHRPTDWKGEDLRKLEVTHRNSLRLLQLVNNLLDFSRIEAGRVQAQFRSTDLAALTADLTATFRSVIEQAGLSLEVHIDKLQHPVYVDRDMWEKIVLNLLSNAFKYTLKGSIQVSLTAQGETIVLEVRDTGIGIPEEDLPKMFQRFHRVQHAVGRTFEGTGIGLSLISELVKMHGGTIGVESKVAEGTLFTVIIPAGRDHIPEAQLVHDTEGFSDTLSDAFVEEAAALLERQDLQQEEAKKEYTVLIVDDNADLRTHIGNLLRQHYTVRMAKDGKEALSLVQQEQPHLVISDIMMPVMDGIQLLRELKRNPETEAIPVILLSARAGEEARIEGFETGADDYLTKPFSSKELQARVRSQLSLKAARLQAARQLRYAATLTENIVDAVIGTSTVEEGYRITSWNKAAETIYGWKAEEVLGRPAFEILATEYNVGENNSSSQTALNERSYWRGDVRQKRKDGSTIWINASVGNVLDEKGKVIGMVGVNRDITQQKEAEQKIRESEQRFRTLAETLPQLVWITDEKGKQEYVSARWMEYSGLEHLSETTWNEMVHPEDRARISRTWKTSLETETYYKAEVRLRNRDGAYRWHFVHAEPIRDGEGKVIKWIGAFTDIHDRKTLTEQLEHKVAERTTELQRSNEDLQQFAHVASHDLKEPVRKVMTFSNRLKIEFVKELPEKANLYLSKIESSAIRMYAMIDGVLLYSSLNALEETRELIDLNELVSNILVDLEVVITEKSAVIQANELPSMEGSSILLYQLLYNLLNNALKFSRPGVPPLITLQAESTGKEEWQQLNLPLNKEYLKLVLRDNGIGFPQSEAERIFKTFSRLNSKDKYEGTGLGLSLCRKIVERHGGAIYAEGEEGKGAVFTIILPR